MIKIKCQSPESCYLVRNKQRQHLVPFTEGFYHPACGMAKECTTEEARRNWMRFCERYGLKEVIFPTPLFKVVGCRRREISDNFYNNVVAFPSVYFTMKTKAGEYKFVVCLPRDEAKHYNATRLWLGKYDGDDYVATREDLPSGYTFYFDENNDYLTLVWSVRRKNSENGI